MRKASDLEDGVRSMSERKEIKPGQIQASRSQKLLGWPQSSAGMGGLNDGSSQPFRDKWPSNASNVVPGHATISLCAKCDEF